jgi:hypothetical protein
MKPINDPTIRRDGTIDVELRAWHVRSPQVRQRREKRDAERSVSYPVM